MDKEIFEKLQNVLADKFRLDKSVIAPESNLVNDLGIDSFGAIELKYEIENKFGIKIDNSELIGIENVKDIVNCISKK